MSTTGQHLKIAMSVPSMAQVAGKLVGKGLQAVPSMARVGQVAQKLAIPAAAGTAGYLVGKPGAPVVAPVPAPAPSMVDQAKQLGQKGADWLSSTAAQLTPMRQGPVQEFANGFAKNPLDYDMAHGLTAGAAGLGAVALLHHLMSRPNKQDSEE